MPVVLGLEAEFTIAAPRDKRELFVEKFQRNAAAGRDIVGVDGALYTLELRVPPSEDATQLYQNLRQCVQIYKECIPDYKKGMRLPRTANLMRGGAFFGYATLGTHVHFSNIPTACFLPLHASLKDILGCGFLNKVGPLCEMLRRKVAGYGGNNPDQALRFQGPNWVEWREPFSCLTPLHSYILIHSSKLIAEAVVQSGETVDSLEIARTIAPKALPDNMYKQLKDYTRLALDNKGAFDWTQDLRVFWTKARRRK